MNNIWKPKETTLKTKSMLATRTRCTGRIGVLCFFLKHPPSFSYDMRNFIFHMIHYLTTCRSYLYTDCLYFAKFLTKKHSEQGKLCCLKIATTSKGLRSPSLTCLYIHVWCPSPHWGLLIHEYHLMQIYLMYTVCLCLYVNCQNR
jgi:hypothetical protein